MHLNRVKINEELRHKSLNSLWWEICSSTTRQDFHFTDFLRLQAKSPGELLSCHQIFRKISLILENNGGRTISCARHFKQCCSSKNIKHARPRPPAHTLPEVHTECIADLQASHAALATQVSQLQVALNVRTSNAQTSRPPAHMLPEVHVQCIADLQASHAALEAQVSQLQVAFNVLDQRLAAFSTTMLNQGDEACMKRTALFARMRALLVLLNGSKELTSRPRSISESNSVVQVVLKSSPTDCTLQEFQLLAKHIEQMPSVRSKNFPSDYSVKFPSPSSTTRLHICFETYKDVCAALSFDAHQTASYVYREKCDISRNLRAIQVLGVDMRINDDRKILLGRSFPSRMYMDPIPYLHQNRAVWREGSWEAGFKFCVEGLSVEEWPREMRRAEGRARNTHNRRGSEGRVRNMTDLNSAPLEPLQFSISWERASGISSDNSSTRTVPGHLRSCFPAVILRSRQLILSTRTLFETPYKSHSLSHIVALGDQIVGAAADGSE